jgi:hypothetical protein
MRGESVTMNLMNKPGLMQSEIGWAKVFLAFLKEAETEEDQIRLGGMGTRWMPSSSPHHGADLVEYFQMLDGRATQTASAKPLAKAVGSRLLR